MNLIKNPQEQATTTHPAQRKVTVCPSSAESNSAGALLLPVKQRNARSGVNLTTSLVRTTR